MVLSPFPHQEAEHSPFFPASQGRPPGRLMEGQLVIILRWGQGYRAEGGAEGPERHVAFLPCYNHCSLVDLCSCVGQAGPGAPSLALCLQTVEIRGDQANHQKALKKNCLPRSVPCFKSYTATGRHCLLRAVLGFLCDHRAWCAMHSVSELSVFTSR